MRLAIIQSRFNEEITDGLLKGALEVLAEKRIEFNSEHDLYSAPGAYEMPLLAKVLIKRKQYEGVICLGCVIRGETAHFEYISSATAQGLQLASLESEAPISFGVLTTYSREQAQERSKPGPENKGREAALACLETLQLLNQI